MWVTCLFPEQLGLLAGAKVHLPQCLSCPVTGCPRKADAFRSFFTEQVALSSSSLNRKIMDLNEKLDSAKKRGDLYCPRKGSLTTKCSGLSSFCRYNLICGRFKERTGRLFIRSLRWRRTMVYVVKFRNGEVRQIEKGDLATLNIDLVEVVYPGTTRVEVVTELVPQGEEQERLSDTIASFREKYNGKVVCDRGMVDFGEWFASAATGDHALIPERALVPLKTYRIVKIKGGEKVKPPVQSPVPVEVAQLSAPRQITPPTPPIASPKPLPGKKPTPVTVEKKVADPKATKQPPAPKPEKKEREKEVVAQKKGPGRPPKKKENAEDVQPRLFTPSSPARRPNKLKIDKKNTNKKK
ncbi:MAG TPA: hypothetical protein PKH10_08940 [bacterium]|nr:hypothetical protein [bacterium]